MACCSVGDCRRTHSSRAGRGRCPRRKYGAGVPHLAPFTHHPLHCPLLVSSPTWSWWRLGLTGRVPPCCAARAQPQPARPASLGSIAPSNLCVDSSPIWSDMPGCQPSLGCAPAEWNPESRAHFRTRRLHSLPSWGLTLPVIRAHTHSLKHTHTYTYTLSHTYIGQSPLPPHPHTQKHQM